MLTVADIQDRLKVYTKPNIDDTVPLWWTTSKAVNDALTAAQNEVTGALAARGYTAAQAQAWPRFDEFVADIALWWLGVRAAAMNEERLDTAQLIKLDRRGELTVNAKSDLPAVLLSDATGALTAPANVPAAGVGHGRIETADEKRRRLWQEEQRRCGWVRPGEQNFHW